MASYREVASVPLIDTRMTLVRGTYMSCRSTYERLYITMERYVHTNMYTCACIYLYVCIIENVGRKRFVPRRTHSNT